MLEELTLGPDEVDTLADLLAISPKVKEREALCIKIGIDPKTLEFIYHSSDYSFAINLINLLNQIGNTKAIYQLCYREMWPIFQGGKYEQSLKEILKKITPNQQTGINDLTEDADKLEFNHSIINQEVILFSPRRRKIIIGSVIFVIGLFVTTLIGFEFSEGIINNIQLENLLKNKDWEQANQKTTDILVTEAGRKDLVGSENDNIKLNSEEIKKISCPVLEKLNESWERNSQGLYGFRKQNKIWQQNQQDWNKFADQVGWRKNNLWTSHNDTSTINYAGHLPDFIWVPNAQISWDGFFNHLGTCAFIHNK
ncbi:GUN4 domain-containing protein [Nostoc muscorum FACHB-395]|nr:GUN4 domain-containing protein [Desmonostoc muscorum FACHB-395]